MKPTIMDAGPLIAWFCSKDSHHDWASGLGKPSTAFPPAAVLRLVERNDLVLVSLSPEDSPTKSNFDFTDFFSVAKSNLSL